MYFYRTSEKPGVFTIQLGIMNFVLRFCVLNSHPFSMSKICFHFFPHHFFTSSSLWNSTPRFSRLSPEEFGPHCQWFSVDLYTRSAPNLGEAAWFHKRFKNAWDMKITCGCLSQPVFFCLGNGCKWCNHQCGDNHIYSEKFSWFTYFFWRFVDTWDIFVKRCKL